MASVRVRGKKYMALYRGPDGRQKSAGSYPTKKEALRAGRLAEAGMPPVKTETVYASKVRGKATVASYSLEWFANHPMSAHTRYVYDQVLRVHILPALGGRVLSDITTADIRGMFRTLEAAGTSMALGKKVKTVLSSMLQTAAEDGVIPYNPVRGVKFLAVPPKRRRSLTADEWLRVRKYLTGEYRLLCDIVMATGARIEEVCGMRTEDVKAGVWTISRVRNEIDGTFITVDKTKTGKARQVAVGQELARRIKAAGTGPVFSEFLLDTFRLCHWYPACRMAGLDWRPAPRDLRRTFATLAREGGTGLDVIRQQLGHTKISTTDIYLGETAEARTDAMEAVRRALGAA